MNEFRVEIRGMWHGAGPFNVEGVTAALTTGLSDSNVYQIDSVAHIIVGSDGQSPYDHTVNVSAPSVPTGSLDITANGTYDVTDKASVVVNVAAEEPEDNNSGED